MIVYKFFRILKNYFESCYKNIYGSLKWSVDTTLIWQRLDAFEESIDQMKSASIFNLIISENDAIR